MKIVADENMPLVESLFSDLGEVTRLSGREISADDVKDADILLVRSVTKVNEGLLKNTKVKFVGTATIGVDHIDQDWLRSNNIGFANAPGCNAHSVVDYVISSLICLCEDDQRQLGELSVGIIGAGNVGSRLANRLKKLGLTVKAYDPFVSEAPVPLSTLEDVLSCDVVSLHVPLTKACEYPTHHLLDQQALELMKENAVLVNTSRGPVIDNQALKSHLKAFPDFKAVLDVWETEPVVEKDLLELVDLGTAHIAGYSLDGKYKGSFQIYQEVCKYFGLPARKRLPQMLPESELGQVSFAAGADFESLLPRLVQVAYDIRRDDRALRRAMVKTNDIAKSFDLLRKQYPVRREFSSLTVKLRRSDAMKCGQFEAAGFKVKVKN